MIVSLFKFFIFFVIIRFVMRQFSGFGNNAANQHSYAPPRPEPKDDYQQKTTGFKAPTEKFKPKDDEYVDWEEVK
jgi:hypothetical protein